ncbi:hypothetical protein ACFV2Q_10800 [Streptomyces sp. NPDC059650]|uniref:hypothetical protein n=1 Tax=Streptomyces sp. NPDC059650 TaxID=3346896 RepID=UPI003677FCB5
MQLIPNHPDPAAYLAADEIVDHDHPLVQETAEALWTANGDACSYGPGIDARFSLGAERLAFPVRPELAETDYPELYAAPHPAVLTALRDSADRPQLWRNLPQAL